MPVKAEGQYRQRQRQQQGQRLAQAQPAARPCTFGIGQQFARRLGLAGVELLDGQGARLALGSELGQTLLVQGDVQRGAIFLGLGATTAQHGNQ